MTLSAQCGASPSENVILFTMTPVQIVKLDLLSVVVFGRYASKVDALCLLWSTVESRFRMPSGEASGEVASSMGLYPKAKAQR